jgi:hypothetical protein
MYMNTTTAGSSVAMQGILENATQSVKKHTVQRDNFGVVDLELVRAEVVFYEPVVEIRNLLEKIRAALESTRSRWDL